MARAVEIRVKLRPDISGLVKECMLTVPQISQVGDYADDLMDRRVDTGTPMNIFGQPRPPLAEKYAERKRRSGRRPVRDMRKTGATLAAKNVLQAEADASGVTATVGIRGSKEYLKALFAQNVDPWFGLTPREVRLVQDRADNILDFNIKRVNGGR
jgi:hypothetical protein